ncbi:copper resistance protein CopC [Nocardioides sp. GXQ0305]|uniref:copper resistance CopC/CopD family protein n=1 Tax=Nocardioides sp. GXQ0305 TaxID=3423912 RepID=UPI003D7EC103
MTPSGPGRRRRALRLAATGLVALCAVLAVAAPAAAHAQLISTDPVDGAVLEQAPSEVTMTFNEPVRLTEREITVYDADGNEMASEASSTGSDVVVGLPDTDSMERGTYVVAWFVLSTDGHPISGSLTFSVGERSASVAEPPPAPTSSGVVTAVLGVLGVVMYVGLLVAAGLAAFVALVLPWKFRVEAARRRVRTVARVAAVAAVVGAVLLVPVAAAYAEGAELVDLLGGFDPSLVADEMVSALLLTAGLAVVWVTLTDAHPEPAQQRLLLCGAGVAAISPALVGHTRSYEPRALLLVSDMVHLLAGSVWLGGLVGLALTARALARRERLAAETLARFSLLAGGLLVTVAAAGAVLGWRILGSWSAFVDTRYGVLLLVKIGLALVIAAIGGWNRFVVLPRVVGAAGHDDRTRTAGTLTRTVALEASVIVVLLGVTGFLVNQSPRPAPVEVAAGQTGIAEGSVGEIEVFAGLTPRRQGQNTLLVQLQDGAGEPVTLARAPVVAVRSGDVDLGEVELVETGAGTYEARVVLPRAGEWEVQVGLRVSRFESPVTTMTIDVPATGED